jgi:hypothetical protein
MAIFYLLHHSPFWENLENGKRNCRTFLVGSIIYITLYCVLKNLKVFGYIDLFYEAFLSFLFYVFIADIASVGWLYKSYYGRSILNELPEDNDKWEFDEMTHTYKRKKIDTNNKNTVSTPLNNSSNEF